MHILIVDDNSPDGTAELVQEMQMQFKNVHITQGDKNGLGAAYIRGMNFALNALKADAILEMDADFSHKPEDVPRLMNALEKGADFVIGSRYAKGGSIPKEWGLLRRLNSWYGNVVARYVCGIYRVRDCTAGFRAIRATLLDQIDLSHLKVRGYVFQVALLFEAILRKASIIEIPVQFVDRIHGESKLGLSDIIEFIIHAWWLRFRQSATFIKFLVVGASGILLNLGVFSLLLSLGVNKYLASPIAIEISIISNFVFNNLWTFRWRQTRDTVQVKGLKFNAVSLLALGVSYSTFIALMCAFPQMVPQISQLIGIIPATLINYLLNSYWTYRDNSRNIQI
jgi:dolichol-phosphate mannosyltransferase